MCLHTLTPSSPHLVNTHYVPGTLLSALRTLCLEATPNSPRVVHILPTRGLPNAAQGTAESGQPQARLAPTSQIWTGAPPSRAAWEGGVLVPTKTATQPAPIARSSPGSRDPGPSGVTAGQSGVKPGRPTSGTAGRVRHREAYFGKMETKQSPLIGAIWGAGTGGGAGGGRAGTELGASAWVAARPSRGH